ncbi:cbb3-type cytochrome oxidase assembly protein CcoS [sulfur-oxidizing endosymbiont of Gigantopelta aegis]|uniref:cbb3-type cytochrome oxidase assembly protein CcoS n=1 Tax=sulfur-oxidizing endosymbiont of Gigantopelta aegis TaxID=2794934 RepID=UPI0018DB8403|nr:cbb3-type cytochrome oxidase assembly protein CcoS [sulfur-oxidizing endosymbiont of Gigantopelta aegis]
MEVIYGLIPSMIIIGIVLVVILFWAIKSGQFDDLEGDAHRILMDEDLTPMKKKTDKQPTEQSETDNKKNSET